MSKLISENVRNAIMKRTKPGCALASSRLSRGAALIEALVGAAVLAVGVLALAQMQITGLQDVQSGLSRTQAIELADTIIERMRANWLQSVSGFYDKGLNDDISFIDCSQKPNNAICNAKLLRKPDAMRLYDMNEWKRMLASSLSKAKGAIKTEEITDDERHVIDPVSGKQITPRSLVLITVEWHNKNAKMKAKQKQQIQLRTRL